MPLSQNLHFDAAPPKDAEYDHPPGAAIMRRLGSELVTSGWNTEEMDNWRDCGWSVVCRRESSQCEVVLSQGSDADWLLQVAPYKVAGLIGRWFGSKPSATSEQVYELALTVHRLLSETHWLGNPRWRWDGFPDDKHSTPEPTAA